jgi:hypothetical protein
VTRHAVGAVLRMRSVRDRERVLRVSTSDRWLPSVGRVTVLTRGRKGFVSGERAVVVVGLMTADAQRRGTFVDRWIPDMTGRTCEIRMRAVQWPRVHERGWRPRIAAVTSTAGVWEAFMQWVERVLHVVRMANDAIGAANLHPSVVLSTIGARSRHQRSAQRSDRQEPPLCSNETEHQFPVKRSMEHPPRPEMVKFTGFLVSTWRR